MHCPLCERDEVERTTHHFRLRRRDRICKVDICVDCHRQIHVLYPGTQLARRPDLWTLEGLRADARIAKALTFIRKLRPGHHAPHRERWR